MAENGSMRQKIADAKGLASAEMAAIGQNLHQLTLRGSCGDANNVVPKLIREIGFRKYAAIIPDPTYKLMGNRDENKAGDIGNLLNEFEKLAVRSGAAVIAAAHFSKGNQSGKEAIDRISGSGVFARDPDTIVTLTKHEEDEALTVDFTLRNVPPVDSFVIQWNGNWLFERAGLDPAKTKKAPGCTPAYDVEDIMEALGDDSKSTAEWLEASDMSESTFHRLLKKAKNTKRVEKSKLDNKWSKTLSKSLKSH
jgi:hypothetical protein